MDAATPIAPRPFPALVFLSAIAPLLLLAGLIWWFFHEAASSSTGQFHRSSRSVFAESS
jgi:hypothetical protein